MLQAPRHTAAAPLPKTASCPLLRRWPSAAVGGPGEAAVPFAPGEGATAPLGPQPSKCLVKAGSSKPCIQALCVDIQHWTHACPMAVLAKSGA